MKTLISLGLCLTLLLVASASAVAVPVRSETPETDAQNQEDRFMTPQVDRLPSGDQLAKAPEDTVLLYGGPGTTEGKFQLLNGVSPDWGGWFGVDGTDLPAFWHVDTVNAANLNNNGPGNHAMWCGEDNPLWNSPGPGYGNNWNVSLVWSSGPLNNTAVAQDVDLDFFFNYETESCCDFFYVEYDSAGTWVSVLVGAGTNKESGTFAAPGVQYSTTPADPIRFAGDDYGGENGDEIRLRIRFNSDSGWSDADGLEPTEAGAMQVDDVSVNWSEGNAFENFEGTGPYDWTPLEGPFVGNFCKLFARMGDIDPCRTDNSPLVNFVDDGTPPTNGDGLSTGGETSLNWDYGVTGGWVVNYNGGLTAGEYGLNNSVWSPPIAWDLPGTEDDGVEWAGARERHDVWGHLPLANGIFWLLEVRCSTDGGASWLAWNLPDDGGLWYGSASWFPHDMDISEVLVPGLTHLQIRATAIDYGMFYTGNDATPAPAFDNFAIKKYRLPGPVMATDGIYLGGDGFPVSGQLDASTEAARGDLDIPFDRVSDITGLADPRIDPGDSITVTVQTKIPGTTLSDHRMIWIMDKNPLFDSVRVMPAGTAVIAGGAANGWDQWMGEVPGQQSTNTAGNPVENIFFYDLPDVDFMYPADRIRYYIQATDSDGRITTFPSDTEGFADGDGYNPLFAVKGLPSIVSDGGGGTTQPPILFVNDNGFRGFNEAYHAAFSENGYVEGIDYDVYNVTRPDNSWNSNGLGSAGAHGANADQLVDYEVILYETGRLSSHLISDGSGTGGNENDDTIGVLTSWYNQPHDRYMVFSGDDLVSGTVTQGSSAFVQLIMGVNSVDDDVRDYIDGQTTPQVKPLLTEFGQGYTAYGGCFGINTFDQIEPLAGAVRGHAFMKSASETYDTVGASVVFDQPNVSGFRKAVITYPYSWFYMYSPLGKEPVGRSARAVVLKETLDYFKLFAPSGNAVGVDEPPSKRIQDARFYPNPFNPTTTIEFRLDVAADVSVRIYNLRGERVREVVDSELAAGLHRLVWDGADDSGSSVASGVYIVDVRGPANREIQKVALVK